MDIDLKSFSADCDCGKKHTIFVRDIIMRSGALYDINSIIEKYGFKKPAIVCDKNTYNAAARNIETSLSSAECIILNPSGLHADEHGTGALEKETPEQTDVFIAVGSGTIHDITRFVAHKRGIDFISVPTAASVDGFVSTVAAMTWKGFKKSFTAVSPICVLADIDVIMAAPKRLTLSGVSDLIGKYTALADWQISNIVTGEHFCQKIFDMEKEAVKKVVENIEGIRKGSYDAYESLTYGLLLSGLAMQMMGNSRPASGSEHHLSHVWEMEIINGHIDAYHGEKVGVGLCIALDVYKKCAEYIKSGDYEIKRSLESVGDIIDIQKCTESAKRAIDGIIEENTPSVLDEISIEAISQNTEKIVDIIDALPSAERIIETLKLAGESAPVHVEDLGLSKDILPKSIALSPYVRRRLTFMRLIKMFSFYEHFK